MLIFFSSKIVLTETKIKLIERFNQITKMSPLFNSAFYTNLLNFVLKTMNNKTYTAH